MDKPTHSQTSSNDILTAKKCEVFVDEQGITGSATLNPRTQSNVLSSTSHNPLPHAMVPADYPNPLALPVPNNSMHLEGAHISGNARLTNVKGDYVTHTVNWNNYGETDDLKALKKFISFEALFDSSVQDPNRRCHPGTRENVLKRLRNWIDSPNSAEPLLWLYGPAGAGKSAIAQTIARAYTRPKVAATFFFFRSDINRNDGTKLFTTLAYQLAFAIPEIRGHIVHSLSERPDLPRADIETQFRELLARPFQALDDDTIQRLAPVIIIDGVDECAKEELQRQFLKVIGDAIEGDRKLPLRFLVVSRPELHIEQAIHRFREPVLTIDLANLDDAHRDIEKYLLDEFSRIASEQSLDPTWPGQDIINDIVYKSSGNFIFASLVIRFVGDPYCFAKAQLDIVMNMQPPKTVTPFAILDQLFLEIIRRVPDQDFLKRYLVLLTARISVLGSEYSDLYKDDAVLMHVTEQELHANLRRMRSILRFERGRIDVHHKSFVDFLHDPSRSGEYFIPIQSGLQGYVEVFVNSFVRYVSLMIEQSPRHGATHFNPIFTDKVKRYPPEIELLGGGWHVATRPLVDLQDKVLQLPTSSPVLGLLRGNQCAVFYLLRDLMHLRIHLGFNPNTASVGKVSVRKFQKLKVPQIPIKIEKPTTDDNLDATLRSFLAHLPETMENWTPNKEVINLMSVILRFDCYETAAKVRSISEAQKLVDFLDYMIQAKDVLPVDVKRKASLLAFSIYERVPIIPQSYFLNEREKVVYVLWMPSKERQSKQLIDIEIFSQTIFANRMMDCCYFPRLTYWGRQEPLDLMRFGVDCHEDITMHPLRSLRSGSESTIQVMCSLAKAIRYLHSMDVVLDNRFDIDDVYLDSDLRPKIRLLCSISQFLLNFESTKRFSREENVLSFGFLFYQIYAGIDAQRDSTFYSGQRVILEHQLDIPEYVWQLIQRCCADDPKSRPSMEEVVQEMDGWFHQRASFFSSAVPHLSTFRKE